MKHLINQEELAEWKRHPVTAEFLAYLSDRQQALMELWGRGNPMSPANQAEAVTLGTMIHINSDEVRAFYDLDDKQ